MNVLENALLGNIRRFDLTFVRGEGTRLWDADGREYLDMLGGIAVCALGHAHPAVASAIAEQAKTLLHVSNLFYTPQLAEASLLVASKFASPGSVYFCNSGTEANEAAIKLARKFAWRNGETDRNEIVAFESSFHGRTMGSLAATMSPAKWEGFQPLPGGFVSVPFNDAAALDAAVTERTAAVLIEVIQGEGGVRPVDLEFAAGAQRIARERGALLVADEIQTGVARTGRWWGFDHFGIEPDVVTMAKALGNGFPVGAMWASERVAGALQPGDHSTTQGGNPLAAAAVLATLQTIDTEGLVERCAQMEGVLRRALGGEVRGKGLLLALELGEPIAGQVVREALTRGLIVNDVTPSAIRLAPALIVSEEDCVRASEMLHDSIKAVK